MKKTIGLICMLVLASCSSFKAANLGNNYSSQIDNSKVKIVKQAIMNYKYLNNKNDSESVMIKKIKIDADSFSYSGGIYSAAVSALKLKNIEIENDSINLVMKLDKNNCKSIIGIYKKQYFILIGYYSNENIMVETECVIKVNGIVKGKAVNLELDGKGSHILGSESVLYLGPVPIRWNEKTIHNPEKLNEYE